MSNLNRYTATGRLTADPKEFQSADGSKISCGTLAIGRRKGDAADFIPVVAFGSLAESMIKYLHKGTKIAIEGRLKSRKRTIDEVNITEVSVVIENWDFAQSRPAATSQQEVSSLPDDGFMNLPEDGSPWDMI